MSGKRKKDGPLFRRLFQKRRQRGGAHKVLASVTACLGLVLLFGFTGAPALATGGGNNGTIKIHEQGTPSGTESNDPKVCVFNVEGFGFDAGQSGYLYFDVQGGDGPTGTPAGPFDFGPTNDSGYYATQYFNLDSGHYKATLYGKPGREDEKAKSKVFKVQCEEVPPTEVSVPTQATLDPCNPQDVENNVTWKDPLPTDTDTVDWSESNNGATRTATLIGDNVEWSDGTTAPKVFNLPADSGEECEEQAPEGNLNVSSTCESITIDMPTGVKPEGAQVVIKLDGVSVMPGTYPVTPGSHTVDLYVNGDKVDSETMVVKECEEEPNPEGNLAVSSTCESITFSASGIQPEGAQVVIKLDDVTKAPGTYPVTAGSHTVDLYVNGEKVDSKTITVAECPAPPTDCTTFQDENPQAPCYVDKPPVTRVEIGTAEGCKLHGVGGVETTNTVYTTAFSFNEQTQQWVSSETATSSSTSFTPYTKAELKAKGCVKHASPPPNNPNNPDHPTNPPHAGASGSSGPNLGLLSGAGLAFIASALIMLFGARRPQVGEI